MILVTQMSEGACNNGHTVKMTTSSLKPGIFSFADKFFAVHYGIVIIAQHVILFFYQAILQTLMIVQTVANQHWIFTMQQQQVQLLKLIL